MTTYREAVREFKRAYIDQALADANGCAADAARRIGVQRTSFYRLAREAGASFTPNSNYGPGSWGDLRDDCPQR